MNEEKTGQEKDAPKAKKSAAKAGGKTSAREGSATSKRTAGAASKPKRAARAAQAPAERSRAALGKATIKHVRISPRKARIVLNMIRGKQLEPAMQILRFSPQKGAAIISKLLTSAIANARETGGADIDSLWVTGAWVDMGRTLKRYMPAAHGRATPVRKRSSHITVVLGERV